MIDIIKKSVKNYLASLEADFDECKNENINGYVSKIEIDGDKKADVYVVVPRKKLEYISEYWFGDKNFDEKDLTNEIANLIIGNAKIVGNEKNINFNISTPEFLGEYKNNIDYDGVLSFRYRDVCFFILFKEK
jgi:CheY-specific phosphatase CheX